MKRRRHRPRNENPMKLPEGTNAVVRHLSVSTGWTFQKAVTFLVEVGANAVLDKAQKLAGFRQLLAVATEHHHTEIATKKKLAATAAKLREAKRSIDSPASPKPTR